ncbi:helix-turn-helix domain-containing protein [Wolbachia endosymbiont of Chironomus riparius]|uniref:helix-turn-helix domain-containing protein n=1 Tax=Wolbachia endosymbiont of Chironomus riparius TaxID=2883238 RepID=UPI00209C79C7|nr:XRE family transcriptional regulator [Wolbachia endosymbiont of Chironomus riparius]
METISLNKLGSMEIKKKLINIIKSIIEKNSWTQSYAAEILGIDQPKVSQIKNDKINGFSLERLLVFLKKLNYTVIIKVAKNEEVKPELEKVKYEIELQ